MSPTVQGMREKCQSEKATENQAGPVLKERQKRKTKAASPQRTNVEVEIRRHKRGLEKGAAERVDYTGREN